MTPTVDDLIVSVRIDPASDLANLKKQLDSLVGKKGEKKQISLKFPTGLQSDIDFIKGRLLRVTQPILKAEKTKLQERAIQQLLKLEGSVKAFGETIVATPAQLDTVIRALNQISVGNIKDVRKSFRLLTTVQTAIDNMGADGKKSVKWLNDIIQAIGEFEIQETVEKAFKEVGLKYIPFLKFFPKDPGFTFTEQQRKDIESSLKKFIELEGLKDVINDISEKLTPEDFKDPANALIKIIERMERKELLTPELFRPETIKGDPLLKAFLVMWIRKFADDSTEMLEQGFFNVMKEILPESVTKKIKTGRISEAIPDIVIFADEVEELKEILPTVYEQVKDLKEGIAIIDFKTLIGTSEKFKIEANKYVKLVGKGRLIFAGLRVKKGEVKAFMDSLGAKFAEIGGLGEILKKAELEEIFPELEERLQNVVQIIEEESSSFVKVAKDIFKDIKPALEVIKSKLAPAEEIDLIKAKKESVAVTSTAIELQKFLDPVKFKELTSPEILDLLRKIMNTNIEVISQMAINLGGIYSNFDSISTSLNNAVSRDGKWTREGIKKIVEFLSKVLTGKKPDLPKIETDPDNIRGAMSTSLTED